MMVNALRYSLPLLLLGTLVVLSVAVLPGFRGAYEREVAAAALAIDFTFTVPALVFFLLVWPGRISPLFMFPAILVGYAAATVTIPAEFVSVHQWMRVWVIIAEGLVLGYSVLRIRQAFAESPRGDFVQRMRTAAKAIFPLRLQAELVASEVSILYFAWRWRKPSPSGSHSFTMYREAGYATLVAAMMMIMVFEVPLLHLFILQWSAVAAWILTALSLYGALWMIGDYGALKSRTIRISPTHLSFRCGLRWEADIPIHQIEQVRRLDADSPPGKPNEPALTCALLGNPNVEIKLESPMKLVGMYGLRRKARLIRLRVDDSARLVESLRDVTSASPDAG